MTANDAPTTMTVQTANALITGSAIEDEQLEAARNHYKAIVDLTAVAGPRFANAHRDAVMMHNRCISRLRENHADRVAREKRAAERAAGYVELAVDP